MRGVGSEILNVIFKPGWANKDCYVINFFVGMLGRI